MTMNGKTRRLILMGLLLVGFFGDPLGAQHHIQKIATFSVCWAEGMQAIHTDLDIMAKTLDAHRDAELIKQITKVQKELEKVILKPNSGSNIIANRVLKALNMHLYWLSQQLYVKTNRYAKTVLKSSHIQIQEMLKDVKSATAKMIDRSLHDADLLTAREVEARKNEVDSSIHSAQSAIDEAMRETQELIRAAEREDQARDAANAASASAPLLLPKIVSLPSRTPTAVVDPGTVLASGPGEPGSVAADLPVTATAPASVSAPLAAGVSPPDRGALPAAGAPGAVSALPVAPSAGPTTMTPSGAQAGSTNEAGALNSAGGPGFAGDLPVWTPPPEPAFPASGPRIISLSPAPGLQPFDVPPAQPPLPDSPEGFDTPPSASETLGLPDLTGLATGSL
jgi:hypothetical protein